MNKLYHALFALAWFYVLMTMADILEAGSHDIFDFMLVILAIGCAMTQIFYLLADAYTNPFSE